MGEIMIAVLKMPDELFWCDNPITRMQHNNIRKEAAEEIIRLSNENAQLRKWMWLNHGHTGQYGDDGEMQCYECERQYGFYDWKRTPIDEIFNRIQTANIAALQHDIKFDRKK